MQIQTSLRLLMNCASSQFLLRQIFGTSVVKRGKYFSYCRIIRPILHRWCLPHYVWAVQLHRCPHAVRKPNICTFSALQSPTLCFVTLNFIRCWMNALKIWKLWPNFLYSMLNQMMYVQQTVCLQKWMTIPISCEEILFSFSIFCSLWNNLLEFSPEEIDGTTDIAFITRSSGTTGMPKGAIQITFIINILQIIFDQLRDI